MNRRRNDEYRQSSDSRSLQVSGSRGDLPWDEDEHASRSQDDPRLLPQIQKSVDAKPDGLLLHENIVFGFFPPHAGMRQYWRDFESLERWTRSEPHRIWWQNFLKDSGGTGFWHETYFMRGRMETIYDDVKIPVGMMRFAEVKPARGPMFGARLRSGRSGESPSPPVAERDLCSASPKGEAEHVARRVRASSNIL